MASNEKHLIKKTSEYLSIYGTDNATSLKQTVDLINSMIEKAGDDENLVR